MDVAVLAAAEDEQLAPDAKNHGAGDEASIGAYAVDVRPCGQQGDEQAKVQARRLLEAIGPAVFDDLVGTGTFAGRAQVVDGTFTPPDATTTIDASASAATGFNVTMSRAQKDSILRVRYDSPTSIQVGGQASTKLDTPAAFHAASQGYFIDAANHMVWIHVPASSSAVAVSGS